MPRRNPVCSRCQRRPTYDPLDAWIVTERAANTLPLMYQRRWCTMCITEEETEQRHELLARRAERRNARALAELGISQTTTPAISAGEPIPAPTFPATQYTSAVTVAVQSERRFGLEIEFLGARDEVARQVALTGEQCLNTGYTHAVFPHWKVVTDASINGPGGELVSPILRGQHGMRRLQAACVGLANARARNDRSTGLHVHHDMSDQTEENARTIENVLRIYAANRGLIGQMLAHSRRNNHYCAAQDLADVNFMLSRVQRDMSGESWSYSRWARLLEYASPTRYIAVNVHSLGRYGTLEFRQHQGTVSFERISAWVRFGQAMIEYAARLVQMPLVGTAEAPIPLPITFTSHEEMFRHFNMNELDIRFWTRRISFFASRAQRAAA